MGSPLQSGVAHATSREEGVLLIWREKERERERGREGGRGRENLNHNVSMYVHVIMIPPVTYSVEV